MRAALLTAAIVLCAAAFARDAEASACRYDVEPEAGAGFPNLILTVDIDCDIPLAADDFAFEYRAGGMVVWEDRQRLRYRIPLGRLAASRSRSDFATTKAGVLAPIAAWLAAPDGIHGVERLEIAFRPAPGVHANHNLADAGAGRFLMARRDWRFAGYGTFTAKPPLMASAPGPAVFAEPGREGPERASIAISVLDDDFRMTDADFVAWIERFAGLTARFWAGFPSDRLLIAITPGGRAGDPFGRVRGGGGVTMMLRLNREESQVFLNQRDWVLTHEMVHLGAPFAPSRQPWFMEGMATYLEPLIRALGGATTRQLVWAEWLRAMPTGVRGVRRGGLDGPGHPYWTGAVYFLLAHKEYVRMGRPDAIAVCFRAIRRELGDAASRARVGDLIATCDQAVGAPVLADLYRKHADPSEIDLAAIWRAFGVEATETGVRFREQGADRRRGMFAQPLFPEPWS